MRAFTSVGDIRGAEAPAAIFEMRAGWKPEVFSTSQTNGGEGGIRSRLMQKRFISSTVLRIRLRHNSLTSTSLSCQAATLDCGKPRTRHLDPDQHSQTSIFVRSGSDAINRMALRE
jgi:hypothetical protein